MDTTMIKKILLFLFLFSSSNAFSTTLYNGVSLSSISSSSPIIIGGGSASITSLGLICTLSSGAILTYSVQVTADPPNNIVNWNNHDTIANLTISSNGNIAYPVTAVRLVITSYTSGSVNLGVAQW